MQITNNINKLIEKSGVIEHLSQNISSPLNKNFSNLLSQSMDDLGTGSGTKQETFDNANDVEQTLPYGDYYKYRYDPNSSQKPNMRELMEALSGKNIYDIYSDPNIDDQKLAKKASEMLYGTTSSRIDTRDWSKIMSSENIEDAVKIANRKMLQPVLTLNYTIPSEIINSDKLTDTQSIVPLNQELVVKSNGAILRKVPASQNEAHEYLNIIGLEQNEAKASSKLKNLELKQSEIIETVRDVLRNAGVSDPKLPESILGKVRVNYIQKDTLEKLLNSIT